MTDLLQSQIKECCRLSMPEGLKDLMSDISREVLRAQPSNLYQFIADYLSALLVARENLTIASKLCTDVCAGECYPELDDELRFIGLYKEDADTAKSVITEYFDKGGANEANLMLKISKNICLEEDQLHAVQTAVRKAFQRNLINNTTFYETSSESDIDDVTRAAKHTLQIYRKTKHRPEDYKDMANKVETSYRAYELKRQTSECPTQDILPLPEKITEKHIRFSADVSSPTRNDSSIPLKPCFLPTVSSTSLAGSYMHLPKYVPYSVHDLENLQEIPEKENATVDYVHEDDNDDACHLGKKTISFHDIPQEIDDQAMMADDDSEVSIDEVIYYDELHDEEEREDESGEDAESTYDELHDEKGDRSGEDVESTK